MVPRLPKNLLMVLLGISIGASYTFCLFHLNSESSETLLIHPSFESHFKQKHDEKWKSLNKELQRKISHIIKNDINEVYVHVHDLKTGHEIGVNDEAPISGGSLLKLPLIMGQLKYAEQNRGYLSQRIAISRDHLSDLYAIQTLKDDRKLVSGQTYTIGQLVSKTIIDSDNVAAAHLERLHGNEPLKSVASTARMNLEDGKLTLKAYSGILRSLYHSTYLSPESSHSALSLMTQSDFSKGLRAGVPENIVVAHKFGEKISANGEKIYFNHCGIVYLPGHPYVLCVSTLGKDHQKQIAEVKKISSVVYQRLSQI